MRRVVALFVVPLVALRFEAANVVASRSSVSGNVAGGAVSPAFDQCASSRPTAVRRAGRSETRDGRDGTDRDAQRAKRDGAWRKEAGKTFRRTPFMA